MLFKPVICSACVLTEHNNIDKQDKRGRYVVQTSHMSSLCAHRKYSTMITPSIDKQAREGVMLYKPDICSACVLTVSKSMIIPNTDKQAREVVMLFKPVIYSACVLAVSTRL